MPGRYDTARAHRLICAASLLLLAAPLPTDAQRCPGDVPLPAYAHNDYDNAAPLTDALRLGYAGVEADIVLVDGVLLVAHSRRQATRGRSLEALYLLPLRTLVRRCGIVVTGGRPFLLNVELKERSPAAFDSLSALLVRYADLLTESAPAGGPAPVEVVLVGWPPSPAELSRRVPPYVRVQRKVTRADGRFAEDTSALVRLVSLDFGKTVGREPRRRDEWLAALARAKAAAPGRLARVYNVPARRDVYSVLLAAGVDLIGTEQLERTRHELDAISH